MNCPVCCSEIDDRSYRLQGMPPDLFLSAALLAISLHRVGDGRPDRILDDPGDVGRWFTNDYDKLPTGALVSDAMTLSWLGLRDKGWFCEEPHYKGRLLHLRHKLFQAKDVIIFIHGFIGDYVNTWGKPKVLSPRLSRNCPNYFSRVSANGNDRNPWGT
jgi:hypothetical protein